MQSSSSSTSRRRSVELFHEEFAPRAHSAAPSPNRRIPSFSLLLLLLRHLRCCLLGLLRCFLPRQRRVRQPCTPLVQIHGEYRGAAHHLGTLRRDAHEKVLVEVLSVSPHTTYKIAAPLTVLTVTAIQVPIINITDGWRCGRPLADDPTARCRTGRRTRLPFMSANIISRSPDASAVTRSALRSGSGFPRTAWESRGGRTQTLRRARTKGRGSCRQRYYHRRRPDPRLWAQDIRPASAARPSSSRDALHAQSCS